MEMQGIELLQPLMYHPYINGIIEQLLRTQKAAPPCTSQQAGLGISAALGPSQPQYLPMGRL